MKGHLGAAGRTGIGLSMKAAILRIIIFGLARAAHNEILH